MVLTDILGLVSKLNLVQGIEGDLRNRRRAGNAAIILAGIVQVVIAVAEKDYLSSLGKFITGKGGLDPNEIIGMLVLIAGAGIFLIFRTTRFFLRESEEPFRYTFSVAAFEDLDGKAENKNENSSGADDPLSQQLHLLHHDLMEKLTLNLGRLSLLDTESLSDEAKEALTSHIHIRGHYFVRNRGEKEESIHVMPRIRIGNNEQPEELAPRIEQSTQISKQEEGVSKYRFILEQVYSRVATAIYQKIRSDIRHKIQLFPIRYRAIGLYHEAQDFERSNTVDAYDYAIELYSESLRYFDMRRFQGLKCGLLKRRGLWRLVRRSQLAEARARVANGRCLIYRNMVSALSGRTRNPLFHVPDEVQKAVQTLKLLFERTAPHSSKRNHPGKPVPAPEARVHTSPALYLTYPRNASASRGERIFDEHRMALFEALLVLSLACNQAGATNKARDILEEARSVAPDLLEQSPLYMLAEAETISDLQTKLQLLRNASDLAPAFEIVQFQLAHFSDMQFRMHNELSAERAAPVLNAFRYVQKLNHGNIGAYAAYGYLQWLLEENKKAEEDYKEGLNVKTIRRQTFVGDLNYGLARIAAEAGYFDKSFNLYRQALTADPNVGVYTDLQSKSFNRYFDYFVKSMLSRYEKFVDTVSKRVVNQGDITEVETLGGEIMKVSRRTAGGVMSFVLNDYGNACFQYYRRTGIRDYLDKAVEIYKDAREQYPENAVVYFNLSTALTYSQGIDDKSIEYFEDAERLEPGWRELRMYSIEDSLSYVMNSTRDLVRECDEISKEIKRLDNEKNLLEAQEEDLLNVKSKVPQSELPNIQWSHDNRKQAEYENRKKILEIENKIKQKNDQLSDIEGQILDLDKARRTQILPRLQKLIRGTSLRPFFDVVEIQDLARAVPGFLENRLRNDRLDADSAKTLQILARLLVAHADNHPDKISCDSAISLSNYVIEQFYPEDFNLALSLRGLYSRIGDSHGEANAIRTIRSAIEDSLATDLTNYHYLQWAILYFDMSIFSVTEISKIGVAGNCLLDIRETPVPVPQPLLELFFRKGIHLPDGAYVRAIDQDSRWQLCEGFNQPIYSLSLHNAGRERTIYVTSDENRREGCLMDALSDRQDVTDKRKIAVLHEMLARIYYETNRDDKALTHYETALEMDPDNWRYHNRLGNLHYQHSRYERAVEYYQRATELNPNDDVLFSNLALAEEHAPDSRGWRRALTALTRARELKPQDKDYADRIDGVNNKITTAELIGDHNMEKFPVVTPIAVEVAGNLIPLVEGPAGGSELSDRFSGLMQNMREDIYREIGVRIPGTRVRGNETDLPDGIYIIMINEIPLVSGTVYPGKYAAAGTTGNPGSVKADAVPTTDPRTGAEMFWLEAADAEDLRHKDLEVWDALEYMVNHLRAVIIRNIVEFLGHQEVLDLTEEQSQLSSDKDNVFISGFTQVLRALVEEEVPITELGVIMKEYLKLSSVGEDYAAIAEGIRRLPVIKPRLHGNEESSVLYCFDDDIEKMLSQGVYKVDHNIVLRLEPEPTQEILTAVRNVIKNGEPASRQALVVRNRAIRRATRKLLELEFPQLWVLANDELDPARDLAAATGIGLSP